MKINPIQRYAGQAMYNAAFDNWILSATRMRSGRNVMQVIPKSRSLDRLGLVLKVLLSRIYAYRCIHPYTRINDIRNRYMPHAL